MGLVTNSADTQITTMLTITPTGVGDSTEYLFFVSPLCSLRHLFFFNLILSRWSLHSFPLGFLVPCFFAHTKDPWTVLISYTNSSTTIGVTSIIITIVYAICVTVTTIVPVVMQIPYGVQILKMILDHHFPLILSTQNNYCMFHRPCNYEIM